MKHVRVIKILLGLILIFSGITKIIDPSEAVDLMLEFKIIPEVMIIYIISILNVSEILIGVFLISGLYHRLAIISALVLFSGFFLISIYGTIIGINSNCGCFGSIVKSRIGWGMVVRNGVLVAGAVYAGRSKIKLNKSVIRNFRC